MYITDIERLSLLIEDGRHLLGVETESDLRRFFATSKTRIGEVFHMSVDEVLSRFADEPDPIEHVRSYLLWEYIAFNIAELHGARLHLQEMRE
jgi:hypothetical protein